MIFPELTLDLIGLVAFTTLGTAFRRGIATRRRLCALRRDLAEAQGAAQIGSWSWDLASGRLTWSDETFRLHRQRRGEFSEHIGGFLQAIHPDDRALIGEQATAAISDLRPKRFEYRVSGPSGERRLMIRARVITGPAGDVIRFAGTVQDVTEARAAEEQLAELRQRLEHAFHDAPIGVAIVGARPGDLGRLLEVNQAFCEIMGRSGTDLLDRHVQDLFDPDATTRMESLFDGVAADTARRFKCERTFTRPDGHERWLSITGSVVRDERDEPLYCICQTQDVTDARRAVEDLRHQATHDDLTRLPLRAPFMEDLRIALVGLEAGGPAPAVLFMDLDNFKLVNDTLGRDAGDTVLCKVADRLRAGVRPGDHVARFSGDEFAVLCHAVDSRVELFEIAARLREAVGECIEFGGRRVCPQVSMGVVHVEAPRAPEFVLRDADTALYAARSHGRGRVELFEPELHDRALRRIELEAAMADAIANDELRVVYQPIVELATGRHVAYEALVRWDSARLGPVPPSTFIPVAEATGMIESIGEWVLRRACVAATRWRRLNPDLTVTVNLSPRQFRDQQLLDKVERALADSGLPPEGLCLEITETAVMEEFETAITTLAALKARGVSVALDDFGSGMSSLARLRLLPIDVLKIDRLFTHRLGHDRADDAIVAAIIQLSNQLGFRTVVEGIEEAGQAEALRALHATYGQGFLFARPLAEAGVDALEPTHARAQLVPAALVA